MIADDQAAAARRLHVAPVPVAVLLRDRNEGTVVRPVPVKAVAAEAEAQLVRLGPIARLPAPDREQADHQALVGGAIEIVELALRFQIIALGVELVRPDPRRRLARLPACADQRIGILPVRPHPSQSTGVGPDTIDPDLAERVVERSRPVAARPAFGHRLAPMDAVRREVQR